MNKQQPENDEQLGRLLSQSNHAVEIDSPALAKLVLDRVKYRRRGMRRLAGGTVLLLFVALICLYPILNNNDRPRFSSDVANSNVEIPETVLSPDDFEIDALDAIEQRRELSESTRTLRRLKSELAQLNRVEQQQQLVLTGQRLSQSVISQMKSPYPVYIGD